MEERRENVNRTGNSRHQETEFKIQKALLALLEQKTLRTITVRELCETAQINKATFYRHYQDVYELAEKTERRIHAGMMELLDAERKRSLTEPVGQRELADVIRYIGEHTVFYLEFLKTGYDTFLDKGFMNLWEKTIRQQFQAMGVTSERRMQYYYRFYQAGVRTTVLHWLETGRQESPEELAQIIWRMSFGRPPGNGGECHTGED